MLLLDERIKADGARSRTWATSDGERIRITDDDGALGELPLTVVDHVMRRYGRPIERDIALEGASLPCGACQLRRLRFQAAVDTEGRDYLVWERRGEEPVACLATTATAALRFLLARAKGSPSGI
jgi:hypothetical protein